MSFIIFLYIFISLIEYKSFFKPILASFFKFVSINAYKEVYIVLTTDNNAALFVIYEIPSVYLLP